MRREDLELVHIPAATFWMGCNHGADNQVPAHVVRVGAFCMMRKPISRLIYQAFLDRTGTTAPSFWGEARFAHLRQPAVGPSWYDTVAFAAWASEQIGESLRLPTEAEREWAGLGGDPYLLYPWGNAPRAVPSGPLGDGPPLLGSTPPNGFGLFHTADCVHEWCLDWYARDAYAYGPDDEPTGPPDGVRKAARGGSWRHKIPVTPTRARSSLPPDHRYADFGFRLVMPA